MRRRDVSWTIALCAALAVHTFMMRGLLYVYVQELDRRFQTSASVARTPTSQGDMVLPAPPPQIRDQFGESDGQGTAMNSAPGDQPLQGPPSPQDQAYLSRDPAGPGRMAEEPSPSTALPGVNGDNRPPSPAGGGGNNSRQQQQTRRRAIFDAIEDPPASPAPQPDLVTAIPQPKLTRQPPQPPAPPPPPPPPPPPVVAQVTPPPVQPIAIIQPAVLQPTTAPSVLALAVVVPPVTPPVVPAPATTPNDTASTTPLPLTPAPALPAPASPIAPPSPTPPAAPTAPAAERAAQAPAPAPQPAAEQATTPALPSPRPAANQAAAKPGQSGPASPGGRGPAGPLMPAADPAPMSDQESDAFTQAGSVSIRAGSIQARLGRKVKTIKPRLGLKGELDLYSLSNPTLILKVFIDAAGKVTDVAVMKSSGSNEVDHPTCLAVYRWWFEPGKNRQGQPIPDVVIFTINWR